MISNGTKADLFIRQMIDYFKINNQELISDLILMFKNKKYEMDIKSIIYFFESFQNDNKNWNEKLSNKLTNLSEMDLQELKKNLKELRNNGIYDYENRNNYYTLFNCLYNKREAIDFLLFKSNRDISYLYDRINPINSTITEKDLKDTEECIKIFKEFIELKDNFKIFNHIKALNIYQISIIENYSKKYTSIIELDRNDSYDSSYNLYRQIHHYIEDANFTFRQDTENFSYGEFGTTNMEELIHLRNKIYIKPQKEIKEPNEFQKKCFKLIFFKDIISNLEVIYEYMKKLRIKGSNLPILINIRIKYPNIDYFLNKKRTSFNNIRDFLFFVKADLITQLDSAYKEKEILRFLFGKLFRNIIKHLDGGYNILDILKYILNKTDNKIEIIDGKAINPIKTEDYVQKFKIYHENSFNNISYYLTSLFENNSIS